MYLRKKKLFLMKFSSIIPTKLLFIICFLLLNNDINAQTELFSYEQFTNADGETLNYRRLFSDYDAKSKYPLVIFLHGMGERGSDNQAQLKWGVPNFASDRIMKMHRPIVIAPQCPDDMVWGNYSYQDMAIQPEPTKPMRLLIELIKSSITNLPVDPSRIYVTGLSMGAYGTYDLVTREPDLFAAAVPVCGAGDSSKAPEIAHIPMWIFHGVLDDAVKVDHSTNMVKALMTEGAYPGYTQYPEAGHFSWIAAYSDEMMMNWLFRQKKH
jgi:predicted peptidase